MKGRSRIIIDPVTRIEGHGRISIRLDKRGKVRDASFITVEFRGFEKFCEGRMLWDLPQLTSRICGFCPASHHLASVKACEDLLGVEVPRPAALLRELLHMGQIIQSHALHFFFLALPDFLTAELGAEERNLFGLLEKDKQGATNAILLRKAGQQIVDRVGGSRLHPVSCIPGGMSRPLSYNDRMALLDQIAGGIQLAQLAVSTIKGLYEKNRDRFATFACFPSLYMGLVKDGNLELYDGVLRVIDDKGDIQREFDPREYRDHFEESSDTTTYMKTVQLKGGGKLGHRVAPLARLNVAQAITTELANAELKELKEIGGGRPLHGSLFYHYARMIELLYACERARDLLRDPEITSPNVRVPVQRRGGEGVGAIEAPRGTLIHHYQADEDGRVTGVNLIVATAHNKGAMNESVKSVARTIVQGGEIPQEQLFQLEAAIRCYDPCLSCSTHEYGRMPLDVTIEAVDGRPLRRYSHGNA